MDKKNSDKRIIERDFSRGLITKAEYDKVIKSLGDEASNATYVVIDPEDPEISFSNNGVE